MFLCKNFQEIQSRAHSASRPSSVSVMTQCEDELVMGEYGERYTTLQQIGKGAYGYVKMAYRNEDNVLVSISPLKCMILSHPQTKLKQDKFQIFVFFFRL